MSNRVILTNAEFQEFIATHRHMTVAEQFDALAIRGGIDLRWETANLNQRSNWMDLLGNAPTSHLAH